VAGQSKSYMGIGRTPKKLSLGEQETERMAIQSRKSESNSIAFGDVGDVGDVGEVSVSKVVANEGIRKTQCCTARDNRSRTHFSQSESAECTDRN
jgi:hypothetical protein